MKSCPTCSRTYSDDTMTFCLVDGAVLSAPYDSQDTASSREPRQTDPHTAQTEYYDSQRDQATIQSPAPQYNYGQQQSWAAATPPPRPGRSYVWLMAVAALLLVAFGAGLAIFLSRAGLFGGSNSSSGVKEKETVSSNNSSNDNRSSANNQSGTSNEPVVSSSPATASKPGATPSPSATPAPSLNIAGTWTGTYTVDPATLTISSQTGDNVSGTLNSGGYLIAVSGSVNPTTRAIVLRETSVLKRTTVKYANWTLGVNSGTVSADGKRMSGRGKAKGQSGYSWSFTKQ
jgi:hypothetical protein